MLGDLLKNCSTTSRGEYASPDHFALRWGGPELLRLEEAELALERLAPARDRGAANTLKRLVAHLAYTRTALFVGLAVALLAARFGRGWHPSVSGTGLTESSHPRGYGFPRRKPSM